MTKRDAIVPPGRQHLYEKHRYSAAIRSGDRAAAAAAMSRHLDELEAMLDLDAAPETQDILSKVLRKFAPETAAAQRRPRRPQTLPPHDG